MTIGQPATIPGFRSETVNVREVRLHYWIAGDPDGQPVLLWHGFLSTGDAWHKVAPATTTAPSQKRVSRAGARDRIRRRPNEFPRCYDSSAPPCPSTNI
jgi:pimeloyl-ACP methyl ester carboxylesterase